MNSVQTTVYWSVIDHDEWRLYAAATEQGLCCVTLPGESFAVLEDWITKHLPHPSLQRSDVDMQPYVQQIEAYLRGQRTTFTCPLDLRGTPFQMRVWRALLTVPFGASVSYSDIAKQIGHPTAVRAVGAANGANPIPIVVPCHRIIGKNGTLTGYRGGLDIKARLLALESGDRSIADVKR